MPEKKSQTDTGWGPKSCFMHKYSVSRIANRRFISLGNLLPIINFEYADLLAPLHGFPPPYLKKMD